MSEPDIDRQISNLNSKKAGMFSIIPTKVLNDTHMEELVRYWKNSLKYKIGCLWRFSYVYTVN